MASCEVINSFRGRYSFLSNFYPCVVYLGTEQYMSVEHGFQAAKSSNSTMRRMIGMLVTPAEAKREGRKLKLRPDWEDVKIDVMYELLRSKFKLYDLADRLIKTGDSRLEEGNTWGDRVWGTVDGVGENNLGRLLMIVRSELRGES